jgi:uncharacterized membrane protein
MLRSWMSAGQYLYFILITNFGGLKGLTSTPTSLIAYIVTSAVVMVVVQLYEWIIDRPQFFIYLRIRFFCYRALRLGRGDAGSIIVSVLIVSVPSNLCLEHYWTCVI